MRTWEQRAETLDRAICSHPYLALRALLWVVRQQPWRTTHRYLPAAFVPLFAKVSFAFTAVLGKDGKITTDGQIRAIAKLLALNLQRTRA